MSYQIDFTTSRFDPAAEPPNDINPIPGQALLSWLGKELAKRGYAVSEPAAEDWGWCAGVEVAGAGYLIGASGSLAAEASDDSARTGSEAGALDWIVQIHRQRSFTDRLFGRNKMPAGDAVSAAIEAVRRAQPDFHAVSVDRSQPGGRR